MRALPILLLLLLSHVYARRYLMFGVNPGEGFNLRRDIYIRVVSLVKQLPDDWVLVLTPWPRMYHWRSTTQQDHIPWSRFFDIDSMNTYLPVLEFDQYVRETGGADIDMIYYLQNYEDMWEGGWRERCAVDHCRGHIPYTITPTKVVQLGYMGLWGSAVSAKRLECVNVQGKSIVMKDFISSTTYKSVYIDRFECLLHTDFHLNLFWNIRKSMVFARDLQREALIYIGDNMFRHHSNISHLQYHDKMKYGAAKYISVHLRRGDFARTRSDRVPSLKGAALKIEELQKKLGIELVFIATDARVREKEDLSNFIVPPPLFYSPPSHIQRKGDGAIAIIEQLIASQGTYFIGTCDSTFSYRIHEERMLKAIYLPSFTYNCFCNDEDPTCSQPVQWHVS